MLKVPRVLPAQTNMTPTQKIWMVTCIVKVTLNDLNDCSYGDYLSCPINFPPFHTPKVTFSSCSLQILQNYVIKGNKSPNFIQDLSAMLELHGHSHEFNPWRNSTSIKALALSIQFPNTPGVVPEQLQAPQQNTSQAKEIIQQVRAYTLPAAASV